jgi:oligosaccharide repeat unit polymerase
VSERKEKKNIFSGRLGLKFSNPASIYCLIWGITLFLYDVELTNNIIGLNSATISLVISSIISFFISYFIISFSTIFFNGYKINLRKNLFFDYNTLNHLNFFNKIVDKITLIWFFFTFLEIIKFGGIPLISVILLRQFDLDYAAFGLPTLHGLLNSLYLTIICSKFILYQSTKNKKYLYIICVLFFWPILLMSRALIIWTILEIFSVYLIFNSIKWKSIVRIFSIFLFVIVLFGYIGDNRGDSSKNDVERFTDNFVKDENRFITDKIPTGFIWVYLYMTTPLNNVVWNINTIEPKYNFKYTFGSLLPSIIRNDSNLGPSLELKEDAFNVSSYFANYIKDFGLVGASIFIFFLQLYVIIIYKSAIKFKIGGMLAYSTLFNSVVMSIFFDYFFTLVTIFQVLLGLFINHILYAKTPIRK